MTHVVTKPSIFLTVAAGMLLAAVPRTTDRGDANRPGPYYPGPADAWEHRSPATVGMDSTSLSEAISFALANESTEPRDLRLMLSRRLSGSPYGDIVGPMKDRGGMNGLVIRHGYIVAEWGNTKRVDMTFSVSKSFLSTTAGLALADDLIKHLGDPVRDYHIDSSFDTPHNATITWQHLLQQTSEWEGELWGKPDKADRRRGRDRALRAPGTFWEYNDVRVNRLALSLLQLWRRPLPSVLKERIMDPIDASSTWEWHGYFKSDAVIDGRMMKSVSGGGHWGGGMWISSRDQARFGYLFLRNGTWKDRQLLPADWVSRATTPTDIQPNYGYMWWLNTGQKQWPSAPASSFAALGGGSNVIWVDPDDDLVVVVRWIQAPKTDEFLGLVLASLN
ncbi:MAG: serine hydrolase domain-containing protein [Gemmatimonadales bacterium]